MNSILTGSTNITVEQSEVILSDSVVDKAPALVMKLPAISALSQSTSLTVKAEGMCALIRRHSHAETVLFQPLDAVLSLRKLSLASTESSLSVLLSQLPSLLFITLGFLPRRKHGRGYTLSYRFRPCAPYYDNMRECLAFIR